MPSTKSALLRFKIIDRCLSNKYKTFPTIEDLRQACEDALFNSTGENISRSTIEKDLNAMRNDEVLGYLAPIRFNKKYGGYYYAEPNFSIQSLPLNDEELQAIRFASQTLYQFRDSELFRDYYSAIDKIFSKVAVVQPDTNKSLDKLIQFEKETVAVQMDHLPHLIKAITEKRIVTFEYVKFDDGEIHLHKVNPLLLKEYRNRWYIVASIPEMKEPLLFSLDRIRELHLTNQHFRRPSTFDADEYFKYSLGITRHNFEKPIKVILSFDPSQSNYLKSKPLHSSQKILKSDVTECKIELTVQVSWELLSLILSYGDLVKVIKPNSLIQSIKKRLKLAIGNY